MKEFFRSPYLIAGLDPGNGVIELCRTPAAFPGLPELVTELDAFLVAVHRHRAESYSLVYDCRLAPLADPDVQRAVARMQEQLAKRFQPMAVVLGAKDAFRRAGEDASRHVHYFTNPAGARRAVLHLAREPRAVSTARGLGPGGAGWQPVPKMRARLRP